MVTSFLFLFFFFYIIIIIIYLSVSLYEIKIQDVALYVVT